MASGEELPGMGEHDARGHSEHAYRRDLRMGGDAEDADQRIHHGAEREVPQGCAYHRAVAHHTRQHCEAGEEPALYPCGDNERAGRAVRGGRGHLFPDERREGTENGVPPM